MSELPGTSAVSIESVEWSAESAGNLTVRITGRWRRRRPVSTGQPTLVIEAEGRRHRYPAMPEPPSVGGTGPGVWRLSFTIPGWMAPDLGRTWLQFGTVIVPLPVAVPARGESAPGDTVAQSAPAAPSATEREPRPPPPVQRELEAPEEPPDFDRTRRVTALTQRVGALEEELRDARAMRDELAASLEERERQRRIAEQRAHAEQALRRDLARQLSGSAHEAERARQAMGDLAAAEERIRALEHELSQARRRSDEAEQVAAAATAARQRAERERAVAELRLQRRAEAGAAESARLRFEHRLHAQQAARAVRIPAEPVPAAPAPASPAPPPVTLAEPPVAPAVMDRLRAELEARARADAALRARLIDAESRLAARVVLDRRTTAALSELRGELDSLADELARERHRRAGAERRAAELERELHAQRALSLSAFDAIAEVRESLAQLAAQPEPEPEPESEPEAAHEPEPEPEPEAAGEPEPAPQPTPPQAVAASEPVTPPVWPGPAPGPAAPPVSPPPGPAAPPSLVEPARLSDALSRLRDSIAPQDVPEPRPPAAPAPAPVRAVSLHEALARPTLEKVFRAMARADPDAAGRLLLELLPLQHAVYPQAVSYDLVLGPDRCVWVSVPDGTPTIEVHPAARPPQDVDFQVFGEPARIAHLLTLSRFRRLFGRRGARVRGRREKVVTLSALLGAPLDLGALHRAGVRPNPLIVFGLLAAMIDPAWTATERFTLAHAAPDTTRTYLLVRAGRPIQATRIAPSDPPATTLSCDPEHLLAALAGEPVPGVRVTGDVGTFLSLRKWIKRAQSE